MMPSARIPKRARSSAFLTTTSRWSAPSADHFRAAPWGLKVWRQRPGARVPRRSSQSNRRIDPALGQDRRNLEATRSVW